LYKHDCYRTTWNYTLHLFFTVTTRFAIAFFDFPMISYSLSCGYVNRYFFSMTSNNFMNHFHGSDIILQLNWPVDFLEISFSNVETVLGPGPDVYNFSLFDCLRDILFQHAQILFNVFVLITITKRFIDCKQTKCKHVKALESRTTNGVEHDCLHVFLSNTIAYVCRWVRKINKHDCVWNNMQRCRIY
jgi:hypothetical protein